MEPKIVEKECIAVVGLSFFGDPFKEKGGWTEENEIGRLWKRFMSYMNDKQLNLPESKDVEECYEIHIRHPETDITGEYEVFVGLETDAAEHAPPELLVKYLPACHYAIFTLQGTEITSDWLKIIYETWMPGSGYRAAYSYSFQLYDKRFKGIDRLEESILDLYIPIESETKG